MSVSLAVFMWWIPAIYTQKATIPPLETMNRSEGVLSFTSGFKQKNRLMIVRQDDGTRHTFRCTVTVILSGTCGSGYEYAGKRAVVWWHPLELYPLWTIKHAVQIEVDGKLILTYEWSLRQLASIKKNDPWFALGMTIFFLLILIVIYKIERRFYELGNR